MVLAKSFPSAGSGQAIPLRFAQDEFVGGLVSAERSVGKVLLPAFAGLRRTPVGFDSQFSINKKAPSLLLEKRLDCLLRRRLSQT